MDFKRRKVIKGIGVGLAGYSLLGLVPSLSSCSNGSDGQQDTPDTSETEKAVESFFKISLAQWSLHKSFFGKGLGGDWAKFGQALQTDPQSVLLGELNPIEFPNIAKKVYGIDAVEYVNTFYFDKAEDMDYLKDLKSRCDGEGVESQLIMCDALGDLGDSDDAARKAAVENHYKWVEAAKFLGCHSIRVNAAGSGTAEEVKAAAVDGLGMLTEFGAKNDINIIVENHGGYSSDGKWLSDLMKQVNNPHCGTLPDFGNFCIERSEDGCANEYDRYQGMKDLIPFAKGVSAKSNVFDEDGNEKNTDFLKMMKIVKDAGFKGYVGIEYEGSELSEKDGIKATKKVWERVAKELG